MEEVAMVAAVAGMVRAAVGVALPAEARWLVVGGVTVVASMVVVGCARVWRAAGK